MEDHREQPKRGGVTKFEDGSSLEELPDGSTLLREATLAIPMVLAQQPAPYNQAAPGLVVHPPTH